ncbi:NADH:ubiquinone oxidoreductase intermediate-associated protein 30, partial [Dimargaris cristalligena]
HIFGGNQPWDTSKFSAVDDRVRGGQSQSYLTAVDDGRAVRFHGNLDTTTLGGAGFASQRTNHLEAQPLNFTGVVALRITLDRDPHLPTSSTDDAAHQSKLYAINLHDGVRATQPDGRRQSDIEFKYIFRVPPPSADSQPAQPAMTNPAPALGSVESFYIIDAPLSDFKPYYRGRPLVVNRLLNQSTIYALDFMMASYFNVQYGPFSLVIRSV